MTVLSHALDGDASKPCLPCAEAEDELRERLVLWTEAKDWWCHGDPFAWIEAVGRRMTSERKRERYCFAKCYFQTYMIR